MRTGDSRSDNQRLASEQTGEIQRPSSSNRGQVSDHATWHVQQNYDQHPQVASSSGTDSSEQQLPGWYFKHSSDNRQAFLPHSPTNQHWNDMLIPKEDVLYLIDSYRCNKATPVSNGWQITHRIIDPVFEQKIQQFSHLEEKRQNQLRAINYEQLLATIVQETATRIRENLIGHLRKMGNPNPGNTPEKVVSADDPKTNSEKEIESLIAKAEFMQKTANEKQGSIKQKLQKLHKDKLFKFQAAFEENEGVINEIVSYRSNLTGLWLSHNNARLASAKENQPLFSTIQETLETCNRLQQQAKNNERALELCSNRLRDLGVDLTDYPVTDYPIKRDKKPFLDISLLPQRFF